jgi:dTMP kinase
MRVRKGIFISFEGPEASGKSSQILLLKNYLKKNNIPFVVILSNKSNISNTEEILLLMAARSNHINNVILPNLKKGKIVISDRFADSTFVYQGFVNNYGISKLKKLHSDILNNFQPDYTFIFTLSIKEIIRRIKKRKNKNKYDKTNSDFHKKVINGYKKISKSKRYIKIDASLKRNIIHYNILKSLNL